MYKDIVLKYLSLSQHHTVPEFVERLPPSWRFAGWKSCMVSKTSGTNLSWSHSNYCPKGILCGRRLKTCVRLSVRSPPTNIFLEVLSPCRSAPYTIFGCHSQGICDHLKSTDRSVLQKHTDDLQHATCQKHTFSIKKSTTGKWTIFRKLTIFGSGL